MFEKIKNLARGEAPDREQQEDQEKRVERMEKKAEELNLPGYRGTNSPYAYWSGRLQEAQEKLEKMKGQSQEEAARLNEEYQRLQDRAKKALEELEEFEVNKLGLEK